MLMVDGLGNSREWFEGVGDGIEVGASFEVGDDEGSFDDFMQGLSEIRLDGVGNVGEIRFDGLDGIGGWLKKNVPGAKKLAGAAKGALKAAIPGVVQDLVSGKPKPKKAGGGAQPASNALLLGGGAEEEGFFSKYKLYLGGAAVVLVGGVAYYVSQGRRR